MKTCKLSGYIKYLQNATNTWCYPNIFTCGETVRSMDIINDIELHRGQKGILQVSKYSGKHSHKRAQTNLRCHRRRRGRERDVGSVGGRGGGGGGRGAVRVGSCSRLRLFGHDPKKNESQNCSSSSSPALMLSAAEGGGGGTTDEGKQIQDITNTAQGEREREGRGSLSGADATCI